MQPSYARITVLARLTSLTCDTISPRNPSLVTIANADSAANTYIHAAIDPAWRAVKELE
jgi:hypothetical protein